ncbi:MAG: MerR family DNA-binding transcriptional regulator [Pseudonocardia sp.]
MSGPELLTTAQAARALGISTRTLVRYAERGYVKPEMVLPSGHRRWILEDVRRQLRELGERRAAEEE